MTTVITSKVWFPVDSDGEPDQRNPDDGCGGGLFKLNLIREFDAEKPVSERDSIESWVGRPIKTIPELVVNSKKEAVKAARIEMQAPEFRKAARAGELALTLSHGGGPATAFMEDIAENPECWFRSDPALEEDHRDRLMESFRIFQEKLLETKNPTGFLQDLEEFVSRPTNEEATERLVVTRKALFG